MRRVTLTDDRRKQHRLSELIVAAEAVTQFSHSQIKKKTTSFSCEGSQLDYQPSNSAAQRHAAIERVKIRRLRAHSAAVNGRKMYCSAGNCHAEIMCWHNNDRCSVAGRRQPVLKDSSCLCFLCFVDFSEVEKKEKSPWCNNKPQSHNYQPVSRTEERHKLTFRTIITNMTGTPGGSTGVKL